MCIDICPVGALTSGMYRYQTRPWEMEHVGTICTHCSNGCKTTLGVRNDEIMRGNNRDRSGINGEFLCIKGRYAFDFINHPERLQSPLVRKNGKLEEVAWSEALETVAAQVQGDRRPRNGKFGVIGSNHTTNEENFYLQKFARQVLGTNNIDHHRTGDLATLLDALERQDRCAGHHRRSVRPQSLPDHRQRSRRSSIRSWLSRFAPTTGITRRTSTPLRRVRCAKPSIAVKSLIAEPGQELEALESLRDQLEGRAGTGHPVRRRPSKASEFASLVAFGDSLGIPVKYVCLVDYSNSRGASDMGCCRIGRIRRCSYRRKCSAAPIWMCCGWWARIR